MGISERRANLAELVPFSAIMLDHLITLRLALSAP